MSSLFRAQKARKKGFFSQTRALFLLFLPVRLVANSCGPSPGAALGKGGEKEQWLLVPISHPTLGEAGESRELHQPQARG